MNTAPVDTLRLFIRFTVVITLLCASLFHIKGYAQGEDTIRLNMRNADITQVVQWLADQTQRQIVLDPRVKGQMTVLSNSTMSVDQAYEVFLSALEVYGFAAVENQGILRVIPASQARRSASSVLEQFEKGNGEQTVYVLRPRQLNAENLANTLRPLLGASGYIGALSTDNQLLIADSGHNIKRLVKLVERFDQLGEFDLAVKPLQYADAETVASVIVSLLSTDQNPHFTVVSDPRSNSLLMSGDKHLKDRIDRLVATLDQPLSKGGTTRVVFLHYADALELEPVLSQISQTLQHNTSPGDSAVSINANESTNALIITAPLAVIEELETIITALDIKRSQVLVEAIIVEVSDDLSKTLGVEWRTSLSANDNFEALTNFGLAGIDPDSGDPILNGQGLSLGFFRNGSLRAVLQAFANENQANILSTPSVLTLDNQEAEILVGSNVPFITGQSTGLASSQDDPFTTIERQDIGLSLRITPQINQKDTVTLDILQELETLSESTVAEDLITNKRSIRTRVAVEDKTILVLGGLVSEEESELVRKVPVLGNLPVVGGIFRSTTTQITKTNLMVFIKPTVLNDSHNTQTLSLEKQKAIEEKLSDAKKQLFQTYRPTAQDK